MNILHCNQEILCFILSTLYRISKTIIFNSIIPDDVIRYIVLIYIVLLNGNLLSCGGNYSLVLTKEGLFGCGHNYHGELGHTVDDNRLYNDRYVLTKINILNVISFSSGGKHTIVLTKEGLFGCGYNCHGELGLDDDNDRCVLTKINNF